MTNEVEAKVTTAVLGVKIDHLTKTVTEAVGEMKVHMKRTSDVESCIAVLKSEHDNLDDKVDNMDDRYKKINIATSVGAAIAFVLAALGFRPS